MKRLVALAVWLIVAAMPFSAWSRGGGGCIEQGTLVWTPFGAVPIENLQPGDTVWSLTAGRMETAAVQAFYRVDPDRYLEIIAGRSRLRVTDEHPIMVGPGEFRMARYLHENDVVYIADQGTLDAVRIDAIHIVSSELPAFNLLVSPGGTFAANGVIVHNKGCFLPETPVLRSDGSEIPISRVRKGDELIAFTPEGQIVISSVHEVVRHRVDEYLVLRTEAATLRVTREHPFFVGAGTFKTVESLQPGDTVYAWNGESLSEQRILSMDVVHETVPVFNLQTDHPNTFLAGGLAVHNKGGGGGGGSRSSSSSGRSSGSQEEAPWWVVLIFLVVFAGFFIFIIVAIIKTLTGGRSKSEELDFRYNRPQIDRKAKKTEKLFEFVSAQDPELKPVALKKMVETTFRKLQECWQARAYSPMKPLMMPALYAQHNAQIQSMIRNNEINHIDDLTVERIDLVNIRYTEKSDQREFTALISASAKDYYTSSRTGVFLRGDRMPARFQEFWTFQRFEDRWVLREIEQAGESDILKEENFVAMLTDENIQNVYAETAKDGTDAAWVDKKEAEKATRIERLLNFLVQTDKLWNRRLMLERARQVFMSVYLAREAGDPQQIPTGDLFPDVVQSLDADMQRWRAEGMRTEYRNLCIRKAELIHVRNYDDPALDEYTVRIDAHAQQIVKRGEQTVREQPYVTPFEEFWTFGRRDNQWKLKEVVSASQAQKMIGTENIDEDSNAGQLNWYYRQTRAN